MLFKCYSTTKLATLTTRNPLEKTLTQKNLGLIISSSEDLTIKIWDGRNFRLLNTLSNHTDRINSICVLPNGYLASGSNDNTIKIWNIMSGSLIKTLTTHMSAITYLAVLNNKLLVSQSQDNTIKIWDIESYEVMKSLDNISCGLNDHLVPLENNLLASCFNRTLINIWNTETGDLVRTFNDFEKPCRFRRKQSIECWDILKILKFKDGLLGFNECGCLKFINLTKLDEEPFSERLSNLSIMEEMRDGRLIAASSLFKTLKILNLDLKNVDLTAIIYEFNEKFSIVKELINGYFVVGYYSGLIEVVDLGFKTIVNIAKIAGHTAKIINILNYNLN